MILSWIRISVIATVFATGHAAALRAQVSATLPQSGARSRDSVYNLRNAQNALKVFHFRFRELIDPDPKFLGKPWIGAANFLCENSVPPYCYGPHNGGIAFGAKLNSHSVEFKTAEMMVPRFLHRAVNREVNELLRKLGEAQKRRPGDRWIVGQRVFHLVEHGELEDALTTATKCRSDRWWCAALVGYSSYLLNRHSKADSAFAVALASSPSAERCRWEAVEDLLYDDPDRKWYMSIPCTERAAVNRNLWWLSDPLFITPGNERFTAHIYREVFRQLFFDSVHELPEHVGCSLCPLTISGSGRTMRKSFAEPRLISGMVFERELWQEGIFPALVRSLGVPAYLMVGGGPPPEFLLQYVQPTYHFLPRVAAVREPLRATAESWNLHDPSATERYHPGFGIFLALDHQMAFFRRGQSARIIAAADIQGSGLANRVGPKLLSMALILSRNPDDIRIHRDSLPGTNVVFDTRAPAESTLVSIEALAAGIGAARVRFASGPPPMPAQRVTLSDILLVSRRDSLPATLDLAAPRAIATDSVSRTAALGLFWEVYGLEQGDTVSFALSSIQGGQSVARSIGRFLGLVGAELPTDVRWSEIVKTNEPITPRAVALDISSIRRGASTLRLEIAVRGQDTVRVDRRINVR